jgi:hypothetical protein
MIYKPKRNPREFGFKQNDSHVVFNAVTKTGKAYSFDGKLLWEKPALLDGQHANWKVYQGDTPPGLYKIGDIYNDYGLYGNSPVYDRTLMAYGWASFDLVDLEGNEDNNGRSGVMIHGGGTGLGFPNFWNPYQKLLPTWGCIRMHNKDLVDHVLPLTKKGVVFCSVYQDDK